MNPAQRGDQAALWNGTAGQAWADNYDLLEVIFEPFEQLLVDAVLAAGGTRVLDVGCGPGATPLAISGALGPQASCTGVDISEPLILSARQRARQQGRSATFIHADAQDYPFQPESFDHVVSRFGVMFFRDPVAAFANLRRASAAQGRLHVLAWRGAADNPFMTAAERAVRPLLPHLPERNPDGPGQFGFADERKVQRILQSSGWQTVDIRPIDMVCRFPITELRRYASRLGPVGAALAETDDAIRHQVVETAVAAFAPWVDDKEVRFTAACWWVSAAASTTMATMPDQKPKSAEEQLPPADELPHAEPAEESAKVHGDKIEHTDESK